MDKAKDFLTDPSKFKAFAEKNKKEQSLHKWHTIIAYKTNANKQ